MSGNGQRKPPRPQIELLTPARSESEEAAIVAALEQFIADTTPATTAREQTSPWLRAALIDGVSAKQTPISTWGDADPWGSS